METVLSSMSETELRDLIRRLPPATVRRGLNAKAIDGTRPMTACQP